MKKTYSHSLTLDLTNQNDVEVSVKATFESTNLEPELILLEAYGDYSEADLEIVEQFVKEDLAQEILIDFSVPERDEYDHEKEKNFC